MVDTCSWIASVFEGEWYTDLILQPVDTKHPVVKNAAYDGCLEGHTAVAVRQFIIMHSGV